MRAKMKYPLSAICFTKSGKERLLSIKGLFSGELDLRLFAKGKFFEADPRLLEEGITLWTRSLADFAREGFEEKRALLFVGATGIAVRAIAGCLQDKLSDSPVLVMDDLGQFVIPLLSGHMGGANALAALIAGKTKALPVITTATDNHKVFAIDLFAKEQGFSVFNKEGIARVSAKVLRGETISFQGPGEVMALYKETDPGFSGCVKLLDYPGDMEENLCGDVCIVFEERLEEVRPYVPEKALILVPKTYVLGMGCKKGKGKAELLALAENAIKDLGISWQQVRALVSVDKKAEEEGLLLLAAEKRIPFFTYTAEELQAVEGDFHESSFVKEQVGVGSVCERAAMKVCGSRGELLLPKRAENGMTIAIAKIQYE